MLIFLVQIIESLLHVAAHALGVMDTFYILNHYSAGVILFGDRTELPRQSLPKVMDIFVAILCHYKMNEQNFHSYTSFTQSYKIDNKITSNMKSYVMCFWQICVLVDKKKNKI